MGKYRVRGLLGRGGSARVLLVESPALGRLAALKLFDPRPELAALRGEEVLRREFVEEARALATMDHPNLLAVWDYGEHRGRPFFLSDYYCHSLGRLLGESGTERPCRRLSPRAAAHFGGQLLAALTRLHWQGMVHRDVAPGNLLISDRQELKLGDLGLAVGVDVRRPSNLLLGTPGYAAPEQEADPAAAGPAADLFGAGAVLHRMLTGRLPDGRRPSSLAPGLDADWDAFLAQACAGEPGERFASAGEMAEALAGLAQRWAERREAICRLMPIEPTPAPGPAAYRPRRSRPLKLRPGEARQALGLDELWRPAARPQLAFAPAGADCLVQEPGGLTWQRSGSPYPLSFAAAQGYLERLNRRAFGGRRGWRLPTSDELTLLLRPPPEAGDLCTETLFDPSQRWLWSADASSFVAGWYADLELGFIARQDRSCRFYVRAVCPAAQ